MNKKFERHLKNSNLSENTVKAYTAAVRGYFERFGTVTKENLSRYRLWLLESYKVQTVNLKLRGMNCYLEFISKPGYKLPLAKRQQKTYIENVISEAEYEYFKSCLKKDNDMLWYFVIRFMAATGARVSELIQIKAEDIAAGYIDLWAKGQKLRRIYIPKPLCRDASEYLSSIGLKSGFVFLNRFGKRLTTRGIAAQLKTLANKYSINEAVVYPHSFRHRFAKSFLCRSGDIALLADLMGHESIETTRIYLRKTSLEQKSIIDATINW